MLSTHALGGPLLESQAGASGVLRDAAEFAAADQAACAEAFSVADEGAFGVEPDMGFGFHA